MGSECGPPGRTVGAKLTRKGPLAGVGQNVRAQTPSLGKAEGAVGAAVGFLARVRALVVKEVRGKVCGVGTILALVTLVPGGCGCPRAGSQGNAPATSLPMSVL